MEIQHQNNLIYLVKLKILYLFQDLRLPFKDKINLKLKLFYQIQ